MDSNTTHNPPRVLGLSALTAEALNRSRLRLADRLDGPAAPALDDVAATLARGREQFRYRCAVVGDHPGVLAELLRTGAQGHQEPPDRPDAAVRLGRVPSTGPADDATRPADDPADADQAATPFAQAVRVAEAWCRGRTADLTLGRPGRRIRLPGYPFHRGGPDTAAAGEADRDTRPLTPLEQRWLFHDLVRSGDSGEHNRTARGRLAGPLDPAALQDAFDALQAAHPLLRTVFERHGGGWRARLLPGPTVALAVSGPDRIADAGTAGFTLAESPLVRCTVAEETDGAGTRVALTLYEPMVAETSEQQLLDRLLADYRHRTGAAEAVPADPVRTDPVPV